jgi:hypothetical protein
VRAKSSTKQKPAPLKTNESAVQQGIIIDVDPPEPLDEEEGVQGDADSSNDWTSVSGSEADDDDRSSEQSDADNESPGSSPPPPPPPTPPTPPRELEEAAQPRPAPAAAAAGEGAPIPPQRTKRARTEQLAQQVFGPPATRSKGPVEDLPNVQKTILERKKKE